MSSASSKNLGEAYLKIIAEAIDCSVSPFALYDRDFNIIYANETTRQVWPDFINGLESGLPFTKAAENIVRRIRPNGSEAEIIAGCEYVWTTLNTPKPVTMQAIDGRWFEMTHHKVGKDMTAGTGVEITKLFNNETQLRRAQAFQECIFESLGQGMLIVDKKGIIRQFNEAYVENSRAGNIEVKVGMPIKDRIFEVFEAEVADNSKFNEWYDGEFWPRFNVEGDSYEEEYSLKDGRHFLWRQHYVKLVGNIVTITDITEIKNAQLKAQQAERAKSEFLANMSHEIRTPMNGVLGMAQLLGNCDLNDKEHSFVKTIERSGEALLTIINDILDFSKIEAGQIMLSSEPFNLYDGIEDVTALLASMALERGIDFMVRIDPRLPKVYDGDAGRFRQVITNLLGNAIKFTHEGHVLIDVSGKMNDGKIDFKILIEDTGIGIPEDQIGHIFDKFRQVDNTKTRAYEGTGLGLSIATQLLGLMGGEIAVKSELNKGTVFTLSLSLPISGEQKDKTIIPDRVKGSVVLVVDDNLVNQNILQEQLKSWGCRILTVGSASKGYAVLKAAKAKNLQIDMIITDYQMPELTGEDFFNIVRADKRFSHIPIIMLTSVDDGDMEFRMKEKGLEVYLTKPPRMDEFLQNATRLLSKRRESSLVTLEGPAVMAEKTASSLKSPYTAPAPPTTPIVKGVQGHVDILVAEDNETNQMFIEYVLKEIGVTYKIVPDGQQAVEAYKALSPRIVLMDVSMPVKNGYEATAGIREYEEGRQLAPVPIIAITAHAMASDKQACMDAGMDDFLSKPIAIIGLNKMLAKWGMIEAAEMKHSA